MVRGISAGCGPSCARPGRDQVPSGQKKTIVLVVPSASCGFDTIDLALSGVLLFLRSFHLCEDSDIESSDKEVSSTINV